MGGDCPQSGAAAERNGSRIRADRTDMVFIVALTAIYAGIQLPISVLDLKVRESGLVR